MAEGRVLTLLVHLDPAMPEAKSSWTDGPFCLNQFMMNIFITEKRECPRVPANTISMVKTACPQSRVNSLTFAGRKKVAT